MQNSKKKLKEALLWEPLENNKVRCFLCSFRCEVPEGGKGRCLIRENVEGKLYSGNYYHVCAAAVDPIEKKPLFHFMPGSRSFSIAAIGCNFRCDFCQNWQISQAGTPLVAESGSPYSPDEIVKNALDAKCSSIAYTYTEPTIFFELADETARIAKEKGLKNIFVSNGYMTSECIDRMSEWLDGINIDLKSFSDEFYKDVCKATLQPVLDSIKYIYENTDIWMELTTLVIPGMNDSDEELEKIAEFISREVSADVPWHISAFYPAYKMDYAPRTSIETLERAHKIGLEAGIKHIYVGNVITADGENTVCSKCGAVAVERHSYRVVENNIEDGKCKTCGADIAGKWD